MFIITIQSGGIPVSRLVSLVCINNIIIINKKLHLRDFCLIRKVKVKKIELIMFAKSSSHKYIYLTRYSGHKITKKKKNSDENDDIDLPNFITKNS